MGLSRALTEVIGEGMESMAVLEACGEPWGRMGVVRVEQSEEDVREQSRGRGGDKNSRGQKRCVRSVCVGGDVEGAANRR